MPIYTIYVLIDPRDHSPRYVGMTKDVYKRFLRHIRCDGDNPEKDSWIRGLQQTNQMVIMKTLDTAHTREEALRCESEWIRSYHRVGIPLFNKDQEVRKSVPFPMSSAGKLAIYSGKHKRYTEDEINQILDWYLISGELPPHVSERQRRDYRRHPRLEERRRLLELEELARQQEAQP